MVRVYDMTVENEQFHKEGLIGRRLPLSLDSTQFVHISSTTLYASFI